MDDYNKQPGQASSGESTGSAGTGTAARMKEQISETAADVTEKVTKFGHKAADRIDDSRESAAGALDKTATSMHSGGDKLSGVAHSAAGQALSRRRSAGSDDSRILPFTDDHARDHHGFLRAHQRSLRRVRKLFPADSNRRGRHGLSAIQHDVVLGHIYRVCGHDGRVFR